MDEEIQNPEQHSDGDQPSDKRYLRTGLKKAFKVINLFTIERPSLRLSDISNLLNISSSSLYPTLYTLEQFGYLSRDDNGRYSLGLKFLERTNVLLESFDLRDKAKPHLKSLATACQSNAHLAILNGWNVLYLEREVAGPDVVFSYILGRQTPIHCTALGKVLLAYQSTERIQGFLDEVELVPNTPHTIVDPGQLQTVLTDTHAQGYAIDDEELHQGVMCVAAPVFDYAGDIVAAISISFPKTQTTRQDLDMRIKRTTETAKQISHDMGAVHQAA